MSDDKKDKGPEYILVKRKTLTLRISMYSYEAFSIMSIVPLIVTHMFLARMQPKKPGAFRAGLVLTWSWGELSGDLELIQACGQYSSL